MGMIRPEPKASNGYNNGDIDEAVLLFQHPAVADGNHPSKASRDYLIEAGYATSINGLTMLTGRGKLGALMSWPMPLIWFTRWRKTMSNPFVPTGRAAHLP